MTILFDTNISLDFLLERQPFFNDAAEIIRLTEKGDLTTFITASSATDIYYIMRKYRSHEDRISILTDYFSLVDIINTTRTDILKALKTGNDDFEDAVTYQCAKRKKVDFIISKNMSGFRDKSPKAVSPAEFLKMT